jgi:energy-coupling factor transporter ATP-binding protein EcfA2
MGRLTGQQMLSKFRVQHYKSLFDTEVSLEPLTVFIGPNGSGKSNVCEAIGVLSEFLQKFVVSPERRLPIISAFTESLKVRGSEQFESKFWHGKVDYFLFEVEAGSEKIRSTADIDLSSSKLSLHLNPIDETASVKIVGDDISANSSPQKLTDGIRNFFISYECLDFPFVNALKEVLIYDFSPVSLKDSAFSQSGMSSTGQGIAYSLVDILHSNRSSFDELEERLTRLVPNIQRILLPRGERQTFLLELVDRYSDHHIPVSDLSDGTLRILAFLTALYQENTPSIICFEEIENGVHPWLLGKMMELLKIVSTEGITGKPVQVLITTHSPVLLNYVEPHQVRAVELDGEGKTQIHSLPIDSVRFQKALEAYDGSLGELWFTNVFGGNPV